MSTNRIVRMVSAAAFVAAFVAAGCSPAQDAEPASGGSEVASAAEIAAADVVVYKTSVCGCCTGWVDHLRDNGFTVAAVDLDALGELPRKKQELGVPADLGSCHTARVGDYVVEGHVPAHVVRRLIEERPEIDGVAVPGMPIGSPGMEGPNPRPYDVIAYGKDGRRVYETVDPSQPSSENR